MNNLLHIEKLNISFKTSFGVITPVTDINFKVTKGETLGIVGESGCGKSVTAFSIIRLLPKNAYINAEARIKFHGKNILQLSEKEMRKNRGSKISMVFQEPMTSLNPVFTVGWQIEEVYRIHRKMKQSEIYEKSMQMLQLVGIPNPQQRLKDFPHHLSGGMRQRVMIALAVACNPELIIADEPTSALDVTIQAQVLELMITLQEKFQTSIVLITHDLGVVAQMCDRVIVMYAGNIVEEAPTVQLFDTTAHPYTQGLIGSIPDITIAKKEQKKLNIIPGSVPHPTQFPKGCRFNPRCAKRMDRCVENQPPLFSITDEHRVRCWLYSDRKNHEQT